MLVKQFTRGQDPVASRVRWFRAPSAASQVPLVDETTGHGTSILSQIVGYNIGLAKTVKPIVVQIFNLAGEQEFLAALAMVLDDVGTGKQAVLS